MTATDEEPDDAAYSRPGKLNAGERAWDRQLAAAGHSALGWRMLGRDGDGHLVIAAVLDCGPDSDMERYCTATFTPQGLVYRTVRRPKAAAQTQPEAPETP